MYGIASSANSAWSAISLARLVTAARGSERRRGLRDGATQDLLAPGVARLAQQDLDVLRRLRPVEVVALGEVASAVAQLLGFGRGLDALGQYPEPEAVRDPDRAADDGGVGRFGRQPLPQTTVDRDDLDGEVFERYQREQQAVGRRGGRVGVRRTKVVDDDPDTELLER